MEGQPKISVIIPVYNAEKYLRQCLDSVLNQDIADLEIICVNDCSTDGSLDILREYEGRDPRVTVLDSESNLRAGRCRNCGLEIARGEYIHFLDADDYVAENAYLALYQTARENEADVIRTKAYDLDAVTGEIRTSAYNALEKVPEKWFNRPVAFLDAPQLFTSICVAPWAGLFRREFLKEHNIRFNDLMCVNDRSFFSESIFNAQRIMLLDSFLVYYRVNNSNSLVGNRAKYFDCHFKSYSLISQASERLPGDVRRNYLENELSDICFWLERFLMSEHRGSIAESTEQFLETMDRSPWKGKAEQTGWYKKITRLNAQYHEQPRAAVENPLVSVIMPVYNAERYLAQSLDSLIRQTLEEIEIICVDDGSTDRSVEVLRSYAARDLRISVYQQKNQFAGIARNNGISHARGNYITFLDSDDLMVEDALESFYQEAEKTQADIVVSASFYFADDIKKKKPAGWCLRENYLPAAKTFSGAEHAKYIFQISDGAPWGKFYRADFVREHGLHFPSAPRAEDFYFVYWAFAIAQKITPLKKKTVLYRNMPESASLENAKDKYPLASLEVRELLWNKLKEIGIYESVHQSFANSTISGYAYHLRSFRTSEAFAAMYGRLKNDVSLYGIDVEDASYFYSKEDYQYIKEIYDTSDCLSYWFKKAKSLQNIVNNSRSEVGKAKQNKNTAPTANGNLRRVHQLEHEIEAIHSSWSYRIGRFVTWLPRKIRGGIRCYREHGFAYTSKRLWFHLFSKPAMLLRKFPGGIRCLWEHGLAYTVRRAMFHLSQSGTPAAAVPLTATAPAAIPAAIPAKVSAPAPVKRDYEYYSRLSPDQYPEELALWYKRLMGVPLNLDDPQTYNEKIQWLKLYDSTPIKTRLADKYLVRDWIKEKMGEEYLIPLLGVWDSFDEIDFDQLPDKFVLKASHGSAWNIIVPDKSKFDKADAKKKFDSWMKKNFAFVFGFELHYLNIKPKIIAEEYMEELGQLYDYKFMCFDGEVKFVWVDADRFTAHKRNLYSTSWERMKITINYPAADYEIAPPKMLDEMIEFAEELSKGFAHVRVDFYEVNGKIYFGEMTFTSGSGSERATPRAFEYEMGNWIMLPPKKPIPKREFEI